MRLKLTIAYVGTGYAGWQRQPRDPTVQAALEEALSTVADAPVAATGASRTDSGVHAAGQVAHADVHDRLTPADWLRALNANLPADVRIVTCEAASADFHARHDARRKTYRYCLDERPVASPFLAPYAWHVAGRLDLAAMREAAAGLAGDIDQRTFASRPERAERPRPLASVTVERDRLLTVTVVGRSFLRYAVRGLVGTLVEVGLGRRSPASVERLARSGDRDAAGPTAPAHGLLLARVEYDTG